MTEPDPGLMPCAPRPVVNKPSPRPRFDPLPAPAPKPQPVPLDVKPAPQPQAPVALPAPLAVADDLGPVQVGDRALPGDLVALLYGMRGGEALLLRLVRSPGAATTRELLSIHPDRLRFVPGLGDTRALALAAYLRDAWQVEAGCLCAEYHDERAWDACLLGDPPRAGEPPPAIFAPRHMEAFSKLGGRQRVRQANSFDLTQLRKRFMSLCKGAAQ